MNAGATTISLVLYALGIFAVVMIGWLPGRPRKIGAVVGIASLGFVFSQTGILSRPGLSSTDVSELGPPYTSALTRCDQLFDALRQAHVVTVEDGEISIQGAIWDRFPAEARDALRQCTTQAPEPRELIVVR